MHERTYPVKAGVLQPGHVVDLPALLAVLAAAGIPNGPQLFAYGNTEVGTVTVCWAVLPHPGWLERTRVIVERYAKTIPNDISTAVPVSGPPSPPNADGPAPLVFPLVADDIE